jgi:hypothetical protein
MPFIVVLCLVLLFFAALGQTWFWRGPVTPGVQIWYGNALFCWGVFFLAVYLTWPTLKALGV